MRLRADPDGAWRRQLPRPFSDAALACRFSATDGQRARARIGRSLAPAERRHLRAHDARGQVRRLGRAARSARAQRRRAAARHRLRPRRGPADGRQAAREGGPSASTSGAPRINRAMPNRSPARTRPSRAWQGGLSFIPPTCVSLPFEDDSFDVVVSSLAIHNVPGAGERAKALHEAARVLKRGGKLVIADIRHTRVLRRRARGLRVDDHRSPIARQFASGTPSAHGPRPASSSRSSHRNTGHNAGAVSTPGRLLFLNDCIAAFLSQK